MIATLGTTLLTNDSAPRLKTIYQFPLVPTNVSMALGAFGPSIPCGYSVHEP